MNQLAEIDIENEEAKVSQIFGSLAAARSIDELEAAMRTVPPCETTTEHIYTPGLYTRKTTMYAGQLITSKIHKHRHPFVILEGECAVWDKVNGWVEHKAPHMGITEPGTRRILFIRKTTVWATFHVTGETELEKIEQHVIAKTEQECAAFLSQKRTEQLENQTKDLP